MKIYNEVILQWDEETQHYITTYEDSFEYDGQLMLAIPWGCCVCLDDMWPSTDSACTGLECEWSSNECDPPEVPIWVWTCHAEDGCIPFIDLDGGPAVYDTYDACCAICDSCGECSGIDTPVAFAGEDKGVQYGQTTTLDGSLSCDPNGTIIAYEWTQITGTAVTLADEEAMITTFIAPGAATVLRFKLSVFDNDFNEAVDYIDIEVSSELMGCIDPTASNYDSDATEDDGNCCYDIYCLCSDACSYGTTACDECCAMYPAAYHCQDGVDPFVCCGGYGAINDCGLTVPPSCADWECNYLYCSYDLSSEPGGMTDYPVECEDFADGATVVVGDCEAIEWVPSIASQQCSYACAVCGYSGTYFTDALGYTGINYVAYSNCRNWSAGGPDAETYNSDSECICAGEVGGEAPEEARIIICGGSNDTASHAVCSDNYIINYQIDENTTTEIIVPIILDQDGELQEIIAEVTGCYPEIFSNNTGMISCTVGDITLVGALDGGNLTGYPETQVQLFVEPSLYFYGNTYEYVQDVWGYSNNYIMLGIRGSGDWNSIFDTRPLEIMVNMVESSPEIIVPAVYTFQQDQDSPPTYMVAKASHYVDEIYVDNNDLTDAIEISFEVTGDPNICYSSASDTYDNPCISLGDVEYDTETAVGNLVRDDKKYIVATIAIYLADYFHGNGNIRTTITDGYNVTYTRDTMVEVINIDDAPVITSMTNILDGSLINTDPSTFDDSVKIVLPSILYSQNEYVDILVEIFTPDATIDYLDFTVDMTVWPYENFDPFTAIDVDDNVYETVVIGDNIWFKSNLEVTHFNNGNDITYCDGPCNWTNINQPAYTILGGGLGGNCEEYGPYNSGPNGDTCQYDSTWNGTDWDGACPGWDSAGPPYFDYSQNSACIIYDGPTGTPPGFIESPGSGKLYNWWVGTDERGVCPEGWHVSTEQDWHDLEIYLGMTEEDYARVDVWRGDDQAVGSQLKSTGYQWWCSGTSSAGEPGPNCLGDGTDTVGFTAWPTGNRWYSNNRYQWDDKGYYWTSTAVDDEAWSRTLAESLHSIQRVKNARDNGFAIRCVRSLASAVGADISDSINITEDSVIDIVTPQADDGAMPFHHSAVIRLEPIKGIQGIVLTTITVTDTTNAKTDDATFILKVDLEGCMTVADPFADNYNEFANVSTDLLCRYYGCTHPLSTTYDLGYNMPWFPDCSFNGPTGELLFDFSVTGIHRNINEANDILPDIAEEGETFAISANDSDTAIAFTLTSGWDHMEQYYDKLSTDSQTKRELLDFSMSIMGTCGDEKYSIRVDDRDVDDYVTLYGTDQSNWRTVATDYSDHEYVIPSVISNAVSLVDLSYTSIWINLENPGINSAECVRDLIIDTFKFKQYDTSDWLAGAIIDVQAPDTANTGVEVLTSDPDASNPGDSYTFNILPSYFQDNKLWSTGYTLEQSFYIYNDLSPIYGVITERDLPNNIIDYSDYSSYIEGSSYSVYSFDYLINTSGTIEDPVYDGTTYTVFNPWDYICNPFNEYLFEGFVINYMVRSEYITSGVSWAYQWYDQFHLNAYITYDCNNFKLYNNIINQFTPIIMDIDTPSETGDFTFLSKTYCEDTTTECTREVVHNVNLQDSDLDIPT